MAQLTVDVTTISVVVEIVTTVVTGAINVTIDAHLSNSKGLMIVVTTQGELDSSLPPRGPTLTLLQETISLPLRPRGRTSTAPTVTGKAMSRTLAMPRRRHCNSLPSLQGPNSHRLTLATWLMLMMPTIAHHTHVPSWHMSPHSPHRHSCLYISCQSPMISLRSRTSLRTHQSSLTHQFQ